MPFSPWRVMSRPVDVVGDQRRNAGAEIDVAALLEQCRGAARHLVARPAGLAVVLARLVGGAARRQARLVGLDGLLDDAADQNAWQADALRGSISPTSTISSTSTMACLAALAKAGHEVAAAAAHLDVAEPVGRDTPSGRRSRPGAPAPGCTACRRSSAPPCLRRSACRRPLGV